MNNNIHANGQLCCHNSELNKPGNYRFKILIAMKLIAILLTVFCFQVSAGAYSQGITLKEKNAPLEKVIKSLRQQSGYSFIFDYKYLKDAKPVNVNIKEKSLEECLEKIFEHQPFSYQIREKVIVITPKKFSEERKPVQQPISGKVTDESGQPLSGATVKIQGTGTSTKTDSEGFFMLNSQNDSGVLHISYLGYTTEQIRFNKGNTGPFTVVLKVNESELREIEINAGYYTVKDRERTGSISKVTAETIEKQPVSNVLMALQNRVPGLQLTQTTGVPGGGFKAQIRGQGSITNGTDPLYIVDGVQFPSNRLNTINSLLITQDANPLSLLDPNSIESIEVLKDADATAIYGSRGANGVILITTKKGVSGSPLVEARTSVGISQVGHKEELMNTEQYLAMRMEAFQNDGLTPTATDYDVNGVWDKNKYTDWQEVFIGGNARVTNTSLNISGGDNRIHYLINGNYYDEGTVFPGDFGFKRAGLHSNINIGSAESKFSASVDVTYSFQTGKLPVSDPTLAYIYIAPNHPGFKDEFGELVWNFDGKSTLFNPFAALRNTLDRNSNNLILNGILGYRILKNLNFKASIGYNKINTDELDRRLLASRNPSTNPTPLNRVSLFGDNQSQSWIAEPQLIYDTKIHLGKLNAIVGASFQENETSYRNISASNFSSDELMENISSASVFSIRQSEYSKYRYAALYGRLNYSLFDRYFLNLTARRDASSKFGPGKQFANFGAIGLSWIFSEEGLIKDEFPFLSMGKIRVSHGVTGNDQILDYGYIQLYNSSSSYQNTPTLITNRIANPDYAWETNRKTEVALQLGINKDKITFQVANYRNRSSNQLIGFFLPPSVGNTFITGNIPAIVQNSGWELEAGFQIITSKHINWSTNFNITIPRNKLIAYPDLSTSGQSTTLIIGKPLSIYRYYDTTVDKNTGQYVYHDINGDNIMSIEDQYKNAFKGQTLYGGLQNSIGFKQMRLDFLVSFNKQVGESYLSKWNNVPGSFINAGFQSNKPLEALGRWTSSNNVAEIPKYSTTAPANSNFNLGRNNGNQSISDNSFLRIKTISLSYSIAPQILSKVKIKSAEINIQGQNLYTLTKYKGLDPEVPFNRLPPLRTFALGIKITL